MKNRKVISLRIWLLISVILGIACGLLVGWFSYFVFDRIIKRNYLSDEKVEARADACFDSFSKYVTKKNLASSDSFELSKWIKGKKDTYVFIYDENGDLIFQAGFGEKYTEVTEDGLDGLTNRENNDSFVPPTPSNLEETVFDRYVSFSDGDYLVTIYEFSETKWYKVGNFVSGTLFLLSQFAVLIIFNTRVIKRIKQLSESINVIGNGNYNEEILCEGNDEISSLANDVNRMKTAILSGREKEQKVMEANRELITSMSHDIRTPLTSLIGYLDIIEEKGYSTEEELQEYIKNCKTKSLQLKDLSDKLFGYFLVFGKDNLDMVYETYDLHVLFGQLIGEHVYYLTGKGFEFEVKESNEEVKIGTDIQYLVRIFNNIFSNVEKYADKTNKVEVVWKIDAGYAVLIVVNQIKEENGHPESTNIGLKSCQKIAEEMKGEFKAEKQDCKFCIELKLPIEKQGDKKE